MNSQIITAETTSSFQPGTGEFPVREEVKRLRRESPCFNVRRVAYHCVPLSPRSPSSPKRSGLS